MSFVRVSCLGNYGRFGNQLLQYAFARAMAEHHGVPLQAPAWVGDVLFPAATREPIGNEPCWVVGDRDTLAMEPPFDVFGYCYRQECLNRYTRADARRWFRFAPGLQAPRVRPWYVACHMRHGDYLDKQHYYAIVERPSYEAALRANGHDPDEAWWVTEEAPHAATAPLPTCGYDLSFLADFQILIGADVLYRGNGSFSWWAGELGDHEAVYAPVVENRTGRGEYLFALGNHHKTYPRGTVVRLRP